jgi:hypothetical protein
MTEGSVDTGHTKMLLDDDMEDDLRQLLEKYRISPQGIIVVRNLGVRNLLDLGYSNDSDFHKMSMIDQRKMADLCRHVHKAEGPITGAAGGASAALCDGEASRKEKKQKIAHCVDTSGWKCSSDADATIKLLKTTTFQQNVPRIIEAMKKHEEDAGVQEAACRALWSMGVNADNQVKIAGAGGIEAIIRGMEQHGKHAGVQERACGALRIMGVNADNGVKIAEAGGIESALGESSKRAMGECCICLERTASDRLLAFVPCGHKCVCGGCADGLVRKPCPICRKKVREVLRVYD